jgi:hypothetical protein
MLDFQDKSVLDEDTLSKLHESSPTEEYINNKTQTEKTEKYDSIFNLVQYFLFHETNLSIELNQPCYFKNEEEKDESLEHLLT